MRASKLRGEVEYLSTYPEAIVLRVPVFFGRTERNGESAINILIDVVKDSSAVSMDLSRRFPTFCGDVTRVIKAIWRQTIQQIRDLFDYFTRAPP